MIELTRLIGTDTCSYCDKLTECLELMEGQACQDCLTAAFRETFGDDEGLDDEY